MGSYILNDDNEPLLTDLISGAQWFEQNPDRRRVAYTELEPQNCQVSTVFLGVDHSFNGGPPVLWETMVFGLENEFMERYTSHADALAGHAEIVAKILARN